MQGKKGKGAGKKYVDGNARHDHKFYLSGFSIESKEVTETKHHCILYPLDPDDDDYEGPSAAAVKNCGAPFSQPLGCYTYVETEGGKQWVDARAVSYFFGLYKHTKQSLCTIAFMKNEDGAKKFTSALCVFPFSYIGGPECVKKCNVLKSILKIVYC